MKALFSTSRSVIEQAIESEARHHQAGFEVAITQLGRLTSVEGEAQTIMFLIGEIAGYGEDGLLSVQA